MPNCDFHAADDDFDKIPQFVFDELNCRVFETYSKPSHNKSEMTCILFTTD